MAQIELLEINTMVRLVEIIVNKQENVVRGKLISGKYVSIMNLKNGIKWMEPFKVKTCRMEAKKKHSHTVKFLVSARNY